jgi:hypothetical protein
MVNRRRFVYGMLTASVLGPGFTRGAQAAARETSLPSLQGRLSRDVFLALRQQTFTVEVDHRGLRFVLVDVSDDGHSREREQFTVRFEGPRDLRLTDATHVFHHPTAGSATLYVQPTGADDRASYYHAAFNLLG